MALSRPATSEQTLTNGCRRCSYSTSDLAVPACASPTTNSSTVAKLRDSPDHVRLQMAEPVSRSRSNRVRASTASLSVANPECQTCLRFPVFGSRPWSMTTDHLLPRLYTPGGRFGMPLPLIADLLVTAMRANG